MNGMIDREFGAQILIALVAVVGAWMMFVEPKSSELAQIEQTILASSQSAGEAQLPVSLIAEEAAQVRKKIAEIKRHNNIALNSSDLYARIGRLAQQHDVIVQNMRPGSQSEADAKSSVQTVKIDLSVEGTYANTAEFLDAISSTSAFVRPVTLTISPFSREGEQIVAVRYVCELLQFKMPEALAAFQEASNGV